MYRLNFYFEKDLAGQAISPGAKVTIDLTDSQFESLITMREIAVKKNLQAVELFIPSVRNANSTEPHIDADFIIGKTSGVAMKESPIGSYGKSRYSGWIDWGTLDLFRVWGDALGLALPADEFSENSSTPALSQ
jgi:hypothetical protein